jgi:predicted nucleic acid-binding protein
MILLDTSLLSLAYRRKYRHGEEKPPVVKILHSMIEDDEPLAIPGIVFQEFLSGVREETQFQKLLELAQSFTLILATELHHLEAARIANHCRQAGVVTSTSDCLIAAMAIEQQAFLFTTDQDFVYMAHHCPLRLFPQQATVVNGG